MDLSITGRVVMSEPRAVKPLGLWGPQDLPLQRGARSGLSVQCSFHSFDEGSGGQGLCGGSDQSGQE